MLNLNDYFQDQYQFTLKDVSYTSFENDELNGELEVKVADDINSEVLNDQLRIAYSRNVNLDSVFKIKITFIIMLTFKEQIDSNASIDWSKEFIKTQNPFLNNIVSRISHLISTITSSYGQQPLITPPTPVIES